MSTQHTPGPWFIRVQSTGFLIDSPKTKDQPHGRVAAIAQYSYEWAGPMRAEALANARLIATAPELLGVLKELQESASYWSEYDVPIGIVDRINAVIAKAEA